MNNTLIPLHPHTNIFGIEVPKDSKSFYVSTVAQFVYLQYYTKTSANVISLPCKMELLGTVKNKVIDFDCFEHVGSIIGFEDKRQFNNYVDAFDRSFDNATDSFLSLMESNNLDLTKDYVILKKI